jgi:hypothetical protein
MSKEIEQSKSKENLKAEIKKISRSSKDADYKFNIVKIIVSISLITSLGCIVSYIYKNHETCITSTDLKSLEHNLYNKLDESINIYNKIVNVSNHDVSPSVEIDINRKYAVISSAYKIREKILSGGYINEEINLIKMLTKDRFLSEKLILEKYANSQHKFEISTLITEIDPSYKKINGFTIP